PRAPAPNQGNLSELLGTGRGRPSWRVLLIGLALILAWLLIVTLVVRFLAPHAAIPTAPNPPTPTPAPSGQATAPPPQPQPPPKSGDMFGVLLAGAIPMMLVIVAGSAIMWRRRWRATTPAVSAGDDFEPPAPRAESLARAAERGLTEIGDLNREPREGIIPCDAPMERALAS